MDDKEQELTTKGKKGAKVHEGEKAGIHPCFFLSVGKILERAWTLKEGKEQEKTEGVSTT